MNVPFLDLRAQHAPLKDEILGLWAEILDTAGFVGGPHVAGLEAEFAAACDAKHALAVSNGTEALVVALQGLGIRHGDEVILPANTFFATAEAVWLVGARPRLVDCLPGTWNIDPAAAAAAVNDRTVGIIGVHLYGQPFDADAIAAVAARHNLWWMEDSAQGHLATYKGRKTGSLGHVTGFSFYPGKNLGATGEGGAVTTMDAALARKMKLFRDHGSEVKYHHEIMGTNARLSSVLAAALRVKLRHLPAWTEARRRHAASYQARLQGVPGLRLPEVPAFADPVWHLYVVHVEDREAVAKALGEAGIGTGYHYPVALHLQPAMAYLGHKAGEFPVSEDNAAHCLSLPMFAELTDAQIEHVCTTLRRVVAG